MHGAILAQDSDSSKKPGSAYIVSGSLDMYYRYNFNNPKAYPYNNYTSFTHSSNSFELGMASVRIDHSFGKVAVTIDLGFGKRAEEFAYNDVNTLLAVKQAYLSYASSSKIKFTLGSWATHVGFELLDAYLNRTYSMSYMFSYGPFSHTGLKADISLGGKSALMVGVANPTDYRTAPSTPKSLIAQFSTGSKDDKLKAYFNFVGGKQNDYKKVVQGDVVLNYIVNEKFNLGFNGTIQSLKIDPDSAGKFNSANWEGLALYINYDPAKWFGLTLRTEYINDPDQYLGFKNVIVPTVAANFRVENLTIIPEFRFDHTGKDVFHKNDVDMTNSTGSFIFAAVYHF
ncbi:MAG: porin [Bacteroidetes bacterium]|nr:MAG: porin [Bacteroidota bacterium]